VHDLFLSYAHQDVDSASDVYRSLDQDGGTVWVDDGSTLTSLADGTVTGLSSLGVPPGEEHRAVIRAAIESATTFVVLDSPAWQESPYCRWELTEALEAGTRLAVLTEEPNLWVSRIEDDDLATQVTDRGFICSSPAKIGELLAQLAPGLNVARANVRLRNLSSPASRRPVRDVLLADSALEHDARLLLTSAGAPSTLLPIIRAETRERARKVVAAADRRRRTASMASFALLLVLATLTATAVTARQAAIDDRNRAQRAAAISRSHSLAAESRQASAASDALTLARQAAAIDANPDTTEALRIATAAARGIVDVPVPPRSYTSATISPRGDRIALGFRGHVVVVATTDARRSEIATDMGAPVMVFTEDGRKLLVITDQARGAVRLRSYDADSGAGGMILAEDVSAISRAGGAAMWLGHGSGTIGRLDLRTGTEETILRLGARVSALDTQPTGLTVLTADHVVTHYLAPVQSGDRPRWQTNLAHIPLPSDRAKSSFSGTQIDAAELVREDPTVPPVPGTDLVLTCGGMTHLLLSSGQNGVHPSRHLELDGSGHAASMASSSRRLTGAACAETGSSAWATGVGLTRPRSLPDGAWAPLGLVTIRDRTAAAVLGYAAESGMAVVAHDNDIHAQVVRQAPASYLSVPGDTHAYPIVGGTLIVGPGPRVSWMATQDARSTATWALPTEAQAVDVAERAVYVACGRRLVEVTSSGPVRSWDIGSHISQAHLSRDGTEILVLASPSPLAINIRTGVRRTLGGPALHEGEWVYMALLDGPVAYYATTFGRLVQVDSKTGNPRHQTDNGIAGPMPIAFRTGGGVFLVGEDGILRAFTADLTLVRSTFLGEAAASLTASPDGQLLLVSTQAGMVESRNPVSLDLRQTLFADRPVMHPWIEPGTHTLAAVTRDTLGATTGTLIRVDLAV
jgi:hypothetical protein